MTKLDTPSLSKVCVVLRPVALVTALLGASLPASAQSNFDNPLGGDNLAANYKANSGKPIDIEADALEVDDQKKIAVFTGNVSATQGDFNLRSREIQVRYAAKAKGTTTASADGSAGGLPGGSNDITQIDAKGKVLVTNKNDMTATSEWAVFEVPKQQVTLGGDVVLSRGANVIKGDKMVIDLKTGRARVDTSGDQAAGGEKGKPPRVQMTFTPKDREKQKDGAAEKKN
jgi:lipopolysaccharide export system protein LptA